MSQDIFDHLIEEMTEEIKDVAVIDLLTRVREALHALG